MSETYGHLADEYDALLGELAETTWRQGILTELRRILGNAPASVVDLGAGTGVGGRLLAGLGGPVHRVGVDRSTRMLDRAGGDYEKTVVADLSTLPLPDHNADVVVSGFDTLNYLPAPSLATCLREAARCLRPGGWVVFDYSSPHLLRHEWRDTAYEQSVPGDGHLHWRHQYNTAGGCTTEIHRYGPDGGLRWYETHVQYALDTFDLGRLATLAGLTVARVRDLDRTDFTPTARTHVWVLRKEAS